MPRFFKKKANLMIDLEAVAKSCSIKAFGNTTENGWDENLNEKGESKTIVLFLKEFFGCLSIRFCFPKIIHMNKTQKRDLKLNWQPLSFNSCV